MPETPRSDCGVNEEGNKLPWEHEVVSGKTNSVLLRYDVKWVARNRPPRIKLDILGLPLDIFLPENGLDMGDIPQ